MISIHNKVAMKSILPKGSERYLLIYFSLISLCLIWFWQLVSCQEMIAMASERRGCKDDWHFSLSVGSTAVPFTDVMEKAEMSKSGVKVSLFSDMVTSKRTWVMCVGGSGVTWGQTRRHRRHLQTS